MTQRINRIQMLRSRRRRLLLDPAIEGVENFLIGDPNTTAGILSTGAVVVEDETATTATGLLKMVDQDDATYLTASANTNGLSQIMATVVVNAPLADLDQFVYGTLNSGLYSSIIVRGRVSTTGTRTTDAPLDLNIRVVAVHPVDGQVTILGGQALDNTAADYLGEGLLSHNNQGAVATYEATVLRANWDTPTYDKFHEGKVYANAYWINREGATADEGLNIRLHNLELELVP